MADDSLKFDLPPGSRRVLYDILKSKDEDDSGTINREEFAQCLMAMGFNPTPEDVKLLREQFDTNCDGKIQIDEILDNLHIINAHSVFKEDFMESFHKFDTNNDGFIRLPELLKVLTCDASDYKMTPQEASELLDYLVKNFDKNHDGKFDYTEFVSICMSSEVGHLFNNPGKQEHQDDEEQ